MSDTVALTEGLKGLEPGSVIAGKYRVEQEIGHGSMGTVFRAVHVTLGQRVAIKLISAEHSQSAEARKRFSVEAKAAAKLRSRHVVQVYDDGETDEGNPYIVLELLEGQTLEQRLQQQRDLPLAEATRVVTHVGRALARAHAQGIVHRDLKPANIFLVKSDDDEEGFTAKVLDFGIAKLDGHGEKGTTQAGTVLGTPLFMSPEQVRGASSVDHRADLYSLGMCLYHMLTGEFAFYSANLSDILVAICTQPLPLLRTKAPWVPEAVEAWFQRACAREPLDRFQSADEMTEALQAAAGGAVLSKHQSVPEGRIAPETLVGYAAPPALATLHQDGKPPALSHTLQLPRAPAAGSATAPGYGSGSERAVAPVAIAISGGDSRGVRAELVVPKSSLRPLVLGVSLGALALGTAGLTLAVLGSRGAPPKQAEPSAASRPALPPPPTPAVASTAAAWPTDSSSSVAGESTAAAAKALPPAASARKRKASGAAGAKPPSSSKVPTSDLGF